MNMDTKKLLVSFFVLASILFSAVAISAVDFSNVLVTVDGLDARDDLALVTGETLPVKVYFTSTIDTTDLKVRVEIEGDEVDIDTVTSDFEVESGKRYVKILSLKVPYELEDDVSEDAVLNLKIWGGDAITYTDSFDVRIQRASYNLDFVSVSTSGKVEAGKLLPVSVVLKNIGYNKLNDLYVTARIPELDVEKSAYFGDLVAFEDDDDEDVTSGKIFLDIPYNARSGVYSLEVEVRSDDFNFNKVSQVSVENGLSSNVLVSGDKMIIANPTNQLLVLKLIPESTGNTLVRLSEELVVIPAGMSKTITASATGGESYKVNIFSKDGQLLDSVTLPVTTKGSTGGNAVAVLTVVLTIIFLVLLAVLIVLVTKKPEKTENLGESYY